MISVEQTEQLLAKLRAGQDAWSAAEQKSLFDSFNHLCRHYEPSSTGRHQVEEGLAELLQVLVINGFAFNAGHYIDGAAFYHLGNQLLAAETDTSACVAGWLDVFRHPGLLRQIYQQAHWPPLVLELIKKSEYTLGKLIQQRVQAYASKPVFHVLKGDAQSTLNWTQLDEQVERNARGLLSLAKILDTEKKLKVAFLCENSVEMVLLDLACLTSGIVNIMIPANSVQQQIEYILNQTGAQIILLGNDKQLAKI